MRIRRLYFLAIPALALAVPVLMGLADEPKVSPAEKEAIAKRGEAFIEAFHTGDAKAVAAFWTEDGDYTDETGKHLKGREAIEKKFAKFFAEEKGLKLSIQSDALRFVTSDVAIEDGTTEVAGPDGGAPSRSRYTIVHVKKDGEWYLSSVREAMYIPATNYEHLRPLERLIGEWVGEADGAEVGRMTFAWSENQGFVINTYASTAKNLILTSGTQYIGWDPSAKHFRTWTFDFMGGFGEGTWAKEDNKWVSKSHAVLQDGRKMEATNVVTPVDADTIKWQSTDRTIDGKAIADMKEVTMKRAK